MVLAEFKRVNDGNIGLVMKGHSSHKECGQLIVCAAISGVFYTLLGYLKNTFGANIKVHRLKSGDVDIECVGPGSEAFRMACIGFLQIGEMYPGEIEVINKVWDSKLCIVPLMDILNFNLEEIENGEF